jgi:outer membrane protein OmpA-like peptidoglycan-associated protein
MKRVILGRIMLAIAVMFSVLFIIGCAAEQPKPEPKVIDKMTLRVLFEFNKATLAQSDIAELNKAKDFVKKYPTSRVLLEGHTDNIGSEKYNMELSQKRAEAVRQHLIQAGAVDAARISAIGFGSTKPIAPNRTENGKDNPEGRTKNRRVEIVIMSE